MVRAAFVAADVVDMPVEGHHYQHLLSVVSHRMHQSIVAAAVVHQMDVVAAGGDDGWAVGAVHLNERVVAVAQYAADVSHNFVLMMPVVIYGIVVFVVAVEFHLKISHLNYYLHSIVRH